MKTLIMNLKSTPLSLTSPVVGNPSAFFRTSQGRNRARRSLPWSAAGVRLSLRSAEAGYCPVGFRSSFSTPRRGGACSAGRQRLEGGGRGLQATGDCKSERQGHWEASPGTRVCSRRQRGGQPSPARAFLATLRAPGPGGGRSSPRGRPVPVTTRRPLSVPRLIRPDRGVTCVPGRPPGGGGGGGGEGRAAGRKRGGRRGRRKERGADSAPVGGGGGGGERTVRSRAGERDRGGGGGGGGGGRDRRGGGRARRKPETAGGPVAGPGRGVGAAAAAERDCGEGSASSSPGAAAAAGTRVRAPRRPAGAGRRGPARWSRSTCAPRLAPTAQRGRNRWVPRPRPPPPASPLLPPPGPGSVQEMARDEVPSCFPAGAALPPPPGLLLARRLERLCPADRGSPRATAGEPLATALRGPFPGFIDSTFYLL